MRPGLALLALLAALPASAGEAVAPHVFEAMAEGRTLHFTQDGMPFGSEQYFPGRRSVWRFADGTCRAGTWQAVDDQICFAYEGQPEPDCWLFQKRAQSYVAELVEDGAATGYVVELSHSDDTPLPCPGPDVGS